MQEDSANLNADMFETLNGIEEVKLLMVNKFNLRKYTLRFKH